MEPIAFQLYYKLFIQEVNKNRIKIFFENNYKKMFF